MAKRRKPSESLGSQAHHCQAFQLECDPDDPVNMDTPMSISAQHSDRNSDQNNFSWLSWLSFVLTCTSRSWPKEVRLSSDLVAEVSGLVLKHCVQQLLGLAVACREPDVRRAAVFLSDTYRETHALQVLLAREVTVDEANETIDCALDESAVLEFMRSFPKDEDGRAQRSLARAVAASPLPLTTTEQPDVLESRLAYTVDPEGRVTFRATVRVSGTTDADVIAASALHQLHRWHGPTVPPTLPHA